MTGEWLAALLSPRDVAPHPNFHSGQLDNTPLPDQVAMVLVGDRWWDRARFESGRTVRFRLQPLADAVDRAFLSTSSAEGLSDLRRVNSQLPAGSPEACATTILISAAAAENDEFGDIFTRLLRQLGALVAPDAESQAWRVLLMVQLALRRQDAGLDEGGLAAEALQLAVSLQWERLGSLSVSGGLDRDSELVFQEIGQAVLASAMSLVDSEQILTFDGGQEHRAWVVQLRRGLPLLDAKIRSSELPPYQYLVSEVVERETGAKTFGNGLQEVDLFYRLLNVELLGDAWARPLRAQTALHRFARAMQTPVPDLANDCIRLLRHSADREKLEALLAWFRQNGPLEVIAADARRVIFDRTNPCEMRSVEMEVLTAGADLLSVDECATGLDRVLVDGRPRLPVDLPGHSSTPAWRYGSSLRAVVALAAGANRTDVASQALLGLLQESPDASLLDREVARALRKLDWSRLSDTQMQAWQRFVTEFGAQWAATSERWRLTGPVGYSSEVSSGLDEEPSPLDAIATRLNRVAVRGEDFERVFGDFFASDVLVARRALEEIVTNANEGRYTMGGGVAGDVAAGLIANADAIELWPDLIRMLSDAAVFREEKRPALERLARAGDNTTLPAELREATFALWATLRSNNDSGFSSALPIVPFPSALRFAIRYGLLPESEAAQLVTAFLTSSSVVERREGAVTVEIAMATPEMSDRSWWAALALTASYDRDAVVRSWAAVSMVRDSQFFERSRARMIDLMRDDGVAVPYAVLTAAARVRSIRERVDLSELANLALDHASREVRDRAQEIFDASASH